MVRYNSVRDILLAIGIGVGGIGRCLDQHAHHVDVVIVVLALHHGGDPLEQSTSGMSREDPHGQGRVAVPEGGRT